MPPKGKKGQDKGKVGEEDREDPLQAVVCTYTGSHMYNANNLRFLRIPSRHASAPSHLSARESGFQTCLSCIVLTSMQCLLPLANTPLIEYTFEFLANAGVEEIFVYCGAHRQQVENYINRSKWSAQSSPFSKLELIQ